MEQQGTCHNALANAACRALNKSLPSSFLPLYLPQPAELKPGLYILHVLVVPWLVMVYGICTSEGVNVLPRA